MEFCLKIIFCLFTFSSFLYASSQMVNKTQEALLSYSFVKEKSEEIVDDIKNKTLGDYADKVLLLAPLVTGQVEFNAYDINFYYDHRNNQQAGMRYNLKF